jgi:hypothetical protein
MQAHLKFLVWVILPIVIQARSPAFAQNLAVRVAPADTSLVIGASYEVSLLVDNASDLGAFEFKLAFLPEIARVDTVVLGAFLGSTGRFALPIGPSWETIGNKRVLHFGGFTFGTAPGASGSGTLAKITITALAIGVTDLELIEVLATNTAGQSLIIGSQTNGRLTVLSSGADPLRTEVFAEPDTTAADAVCWSLVTVIPRDAAGNPLPVVQSVRLATTLGELKGAIQSHNDGRYTQRLYAPTIPGVANVTATVNGVPMQQQATVVFTPVPRRTVRLSPAQTTVTWASTFDLAVVADSVCDLGSFEFALTFPNQIVNLDTAWLGNFLGSTGRPAVATPLRFARIGDTTTVSFGGFSFGNAHGPEGTGALAHLRFKAIGLGTADLNFTHATLTTTEGNILSLAGRLGSRIIVSTNPVDTHLTIIIAEPDSIPADGVSTSLITVIPKDASGNTLAPGLNVELATTVGLWADDVRDRGDGTYTRTLISATSPATAIISAKVNGIDMVQTARVVFFPPPAKILRIAPTDTTVFLGKSLQLAIRADNVWELGSFEFSLRLPNNIIRLDSLWLGDFLSGTGRAVQSLGPAFQNIGDTTNVRFGAFSFGTARGPSGNGVLAWMKLTPLRLDTAQIEFNNATLADTKGNRQDISAQRGGRIIIAPSGADPAATVVMATPTMIPANGLSTSRITVIPKDALGNTLPPCQQVQINATSPGKLLEEIKCHDDGSYTQLLQSPTVPGQSVVTATINGVVANQKPVVEFTRRPQTLIRVAPADTTVLIRKSFDIAVKIDSVWDLGAFEVSCSFKTAVVRFDTAWVGNFFGSTGRPAWLLHRRDNPTGDSTVVNIAGFSVGEHPGPNGAGVLANLRFTALALGDTRLGLLYAQITNPNGELLPLNAMQSGRVRVIAGVVDSLLSIVTADPDTLPADGLSFSTITVIPKDTSGQTLGPGLQVLLRASPPGVLQDSVATYQGDNKYTGVLKATRTPGPSCVTAFVEGVRIKQQAKVLFRPTPKIFPLVDSALQMTGGTFWVSVRITGAENDMKKIARLKWTFNFTPAKELICVPDGVRPGEFLRAPHEIDFKFDAQCDKGKIIVETNRRYRGAALLDSGTVAEVQFKSNAYAPDSTVVHFTITELTVLDSLGNTILLPADNLQVILRGPLVWPGDTNDDGIVNQFDILPIGTYFGKTGARRRSASTEWFGQHATRWQPQEATYANADGNGQVDASDANVVTKNWGRTHGSFAPMLAQEQLLSREIFRQGVLRPSVWRLPNGEELSVEIAADSLNGFTGAAFELEYPANLLQVVAVERGNNWGQEALLIFKDDEIRGKLGIGICRIEGADVTPDRSVIAVVRFAFRANRVREVSLLRFKVNGAVATSQDGKLIRVAGAAWGNEVAEPPSAFSLQQNYPNPFNPETRIEYALPHATHVVIKIHDALGREIATLVDEKLSAGAHFVIWDGKDRAGRETPSGIYFVRMQAEGFVRTMKAVKVK